MILLREYAAKLKTIVRELRKYIRIANTSLVLNWIEYNNLQQNCDRLNILFFNWLRISSVIFKIETDTFYASKELFLSSFHRNETILVEELHIWWSKHPHTNIMRIFHGNIYWSIVSRPWLCTLSCASLWMVIVRW